MKILHPEAGDPTHYWKHRIKLKHLFTAASDYASVSRSMNEIASALRRNPIFDEFACLDRFSHMGDIEVANELLDEFYDFCDQHRIWVD